MSQEKDTPFFVGYLGVPNALRTFLSVATLLLLAVAAVFGYLIATTQDDPGPGALRGDYGRQTLTGVIELTPLPILHVVEGTERIPAGRTIMMSGQGKNGAKRPPAQDGAFVQVSGVILERGSLDMLQLRGGNNGMRAAEGDGVVPEPVDLGRWKLAGEICDGKCLAGIMRPGRGLAHKACANLCILGDIPPVFVSSQPVEGSEFFMITGPGGADIMDTLRTYMAAYISVEGRIQRHGDLMLFALDPETVEVLP